MSAKPRVIWTIWVADPSLISSRQLPLERRGEQEDVMEESMKSRRKRGLSPRGQFEHSKREAVAIIDADREANRQKTENLRAMRLARQESTDKPSD